MKDIIILGTQEKTAEAVLLCGLRPNGTIGPVNITSGGAIQTSGGGGGGGATIPSTTNLISGDGSGNGADSGLTVASLSGWAGIAPSSKQNALTISTVGTALLNLSTPAGDGSLVYVNADGSVHTELASSLVINQVKDSTDPLKILQFDISAFPEGTKTLTFDAAGTLPNAALTHSSMTIAGHSVSLGGTQTLASTDLSDGTTVGQNLFKATNPSAITFPKVDGSNNVSFRTPAQVLSDIGAQASGSYAASGANSDITSITGLTTQSTLTRAPAANTVVTGWLITDTTTASNGNQQYSPSIQLTGQSWSGAASQAIDFRIYNKTLQGGSSNLVIESQQNGGGFGNQYLFDNFGDATIPQLNTGGIRFGSGVGTKFQQNSDGALIIVSSTNVNGTLQIAKNILSKTSNYSVAVNDTNSLLDNTGAGGEVDFTLPSVATTTVGLQYTFYVDAAQTVKIIPQTTATIQMAGSTSTNGTGGGFISSATSGNAVTLIALSTTKWVAINYVGTVAVNWTVN